MKIASVLLKVLFVFSCFYGLTLTYETSAGFDIYISYFTTQSNVLCLIVMIMVLVWKLVGRNKNPRLFEVLKSMATVSILVTFIIYHFLLRPNIEPDMQNVATGLGNTIVHYVTPLWFFFDYMIFDRKGLTRMSDILYYAIFPIYYFVFSNFRAVSGDLYDYGTTTSQFPYPFLDYEVFGIYGVSVAVIIITVAVLILGFIYVKMDHIMKKPQEQYHTHSYGAINIKTTEITIITPVIETETLIDMNEQKDNTDTTPE